MDSSLLEEIYSLTSSAEASMNFPQQRGILKSSMICYSCSADMVPGAGTQLLLEVQRQLHVVLVDVLYSIQKFISVKV
jgi:hypothetical protein